MNSELLVAFTTLLSMSIKVVWGECELKSFESLIWNINRQTLLMYLDFAKPFNIHTHTDDVQRGAVILQDNRSIGFLFAKAAGITNVRCDH